MKSKRQSPENEAVVSTEQGQKFEHIALKQEITDKNDGIEVELRAEMVEDGNVDHGTGERRVF